MAFEEFRGELDAPAGSSGFVAFSGELDAPAKSGRATDAEIDSLARTPINSDVVDESAQAQPGAVASELANLRDSFFTGVDSSRASLKTANVAAQASALQAKRDNLSQLEASGKGQSPEAEGVRKYIQAYENRLPTMISGMTEAQADAKRGGDMTTRPAVAALNKAKTFGEAWDIFKENPYDVIAGVSSQSLANSIPALITGAVLGPVAGASMMGVSSAATEAGSSLGEFAGERGVDMTNPKAVEAFFTDSKNLAEAMAYAGKRAGIIAALDAASGGLAGKTIAPALKSKMARQAVNLPTQMAAQAGLGAGGEAGAQLATKGKIDQPGQVLMEAAGELGGAPMEVAAFGREARLAAREKQFSEKYPAAGQPAAAPAAEPKLDPVAEITKAQTVDEAIAAATRATQSSTAVDNIAEILKQNQPSGLINSAPAATENIAGLSPDVAQTTQAITELEAQNVSPTAAVPSVPAGTTGSGMPVSAPGMEARLGAVRTDPGAVDAGGIRDQAAGDFVPLAAGTPLDAVDQNVQDQTPPGPAAQSEAAPAQAPEAGADAGSPAATAGTPAGDAAVQAAGVAGTLYRGVQAGRDAKATDDTVGGGLFYTPDRAVAQAYAGKDGTVIEEAPNFKNTLATKTWMEAKEKLGLPKSATMGDLIKAGATAGYDSMEFATTNGREVIGLPQPTARQVAIQAEKARIEAKREAGKAARTASSKAPEGLSVGTMPNTAEPVSIQSGVVYVGKYPATNFETGDDVTVPAGAAPTQIAEALRAAGALGKKARVFGLSKEAPAQAAPAKAAIETVATETPDPAQQRADFAAAERARTAPGRTARSTSYAKNPLMTLLAKHGLFHEKDHPKSQKTEFSPDKHIMVGGYKPVFRRDGMPLDMLVQRAIEDGYLPPNGTETQLRELIRQAIAGKRIAPLYAEGAADQEGQARSARAQELEQEADMAQNAEVEAENKAEREAIQAVAEWSDESRSAVAEDDIALTASNNVSEADFLRALGASEQEIADAATRQNQGQGRARQGDQGIAGAEETAASAAPGNPKGRDGQARDDAEGLTSPTPADVLAQQDRKDNADGLDQRQQINREASGQTLTSQTAPEQRTDTSGDMFAREKADAEIEKRNAGRTANNDPNQAPMFSRAAKATDILDAADIKGKDRLEALRDVRAGLITPDELEAAYPAKVDQTETEAFKKWFGHSKVVDAAGKPLVVYHGTAESFDKFDTGNGLGAWFSSSTDAAATYADVQARWKPEGGNNVMPSYLAIKNPAGDGDIDAARAKVMKESLAPKERNARIRAILQEQGFDGLALDGNKTFVAFRPEQIKSAIGSNGDFDGSNPDIRFSRATLEPVQTKTGATAFKTPEIALANPKLNVRQPGGDVKRIDFEIRDRAIYARAIKDGVTVAQAKEEATVGIITLDIDEAGVFKSLRNIEVFQSKRGQGTAEKVVGGIMESLPPGAKLNIHDILPTATGFWDKMGAKFPRSEDTVVTANLTPEQFRSAYDSRPRTAGAQGQRQESRAAEYARTGSGRSGADGTAAPRAAVRNPSTVERVQAAVTELIGGKQLPNKLGRVVATTASEIKSYWEPLIGQNLQLSADGKAGAAQAFYDPRTKTVFLIADHIPAGDEMAVAAHELMHKHGQTVLGKDGWDKLHTVINTWADTEEGSDERAVYNYARSKVEAVGLELSSQELFPYAVEAAIKMGVKPSLIAKQGTVARWLGSVRYAMQQAWSKVTGKPETFKVQDLTDLAFGIAQMENPESAAAIGDALRGTTSSMPKDDFIPGTVKFQPFDTDERAQERMNRATNVDEDYRLPNIANSVPKEYVPKEASQKTVTIYRGVPAGITGAIIRPGDWISLKKQYAAEHGTGETGKSKVISMDVSAADVAWAGTDMNEWFYAPRLTVDDTTPGTDENTGLPLNADGTVTVYHHTSAAKAKAIRESGTLKAAAEPDVYVTTRSETDTGYGDTAVPIRVKPDQLTIDDEFPSGRKDFRLTVGKPGGSIKVAIADETQGGRSADDSTPGAGIKKPMLVDPSALEFREKEQNRKSELTADTDEFDPIVVIGEGKKLSILDGHNRASVALDRGDKLQAVRVTNSEYESLKEKGFEDGEIAWAALQRAGQSYAAGNMDSQFPGAEIAKGGDKAWDELLSNEPTAPDSGGAMFSRTATQTGAPATHPNLSPWRDETGRMQFAPGAWLFDQIGKAASPMLVRLGMRAATPELRRQLRQMKVEVEKAQEVAVAIARETTKLSEAERAMVSDLVEQELKVGVIPPAHAVKLAAMINDAMGRQTDELVSLGMLTKDSADKWRGKYLPRYYESKLRDKLAKTGATWADALMGLTGRQSVMKGIKGKNLRGRGLYETIAESDLANYEAMGWEVRDPDYTPSLPTVDGTVQVWRDFSPAEREKMGEIRDAGFRFVMGYMQTQRDIALGRMFERMAQDPESSSRLEKEGYVQVPTTVVSGTGAKVYGKLAGRWVPTETLSQLSNIEESTSAAWQMYRKAMAVWKMGKTAMNPVSHVNNIVSNLTMAHLAGVSYLRGDKYLAAARDFVKKTPMLQEAKDNGLFLGTLSDTELMNSMPEELRILAQKQESTTLKVARTGFDIMTMFLRKPMGAAYQFEDTFFRYLIYKDARERGTDPQDAVDYAQRYIFTYDDLPKGARRIRDFGIPFFSYTYKAAPALLHTALTHPLRMAAPAAVLWGINAAAYAIAAGDDDDDWQDSLKRYLTDPEYRAKAREQEKLEREHLPPWNKGTTSMLTPKMIRLGMDEVTKLPLFIDISRIIPGGDLFDVSPNAGGIPLPQPVTPSHPLFTTAVAMLGNKDLFRGKDLVDKNDTTGEASEKRLGWLWTQLAPAIAAGSYHWQRGMSALAQANGGEVKWMPDLLGGDATGIGKDGLPVQPKYAAMQTFGIKVRPMDLDTSAAIDKNMQNKLLRDIDAEMRSLQRLSNKGALNDRAVDKARELASTKKDRIRQGLTVDGNERD